MGREDCLPATVRIYGIWIATVDGGHWRVVQGPAEMLAALDATRPDIGPEDPNPDLTMARAAQRILYPGCEIWDLGEQVSGPPA